MLGRLETKQSGGYFKEKLTITKSKITGDALTVAIQKATSHMLKAPKEKYVQYLIACSFGRTRIAQHDGITCEEYMVHELEKRVHSHNWVVVLKTLVVFHRLLNEASLRLVRTICVDQPLFQTAALKDMADTPLAWRQCHLIQQYMRFLEERQRMLAVYVSSTSDEEDDVVDLCRLEEQMGMVAPVAFTSALICQLEALAEVEYDEGVVDNFCTMECYQLLLRDAKRFLQILSKRMILTLRDFASMRSESQRDWLELYRRYDEVVRRLKLLFDAMSSSTRVFTESIPQLQLLPERTLRTLEESVLAAEPQAEVTTLDQLGITSSTTAVHVSQDEACKHDSRDTRQCNTLEEQKMERRPPQATSPTRQVNEALSNHEPHPSDAEATVTSPSTNERQQTATAPRVDLDDLFAPQPPRQSAGATASDASHATGAPQPTQFSMIDELFSALPTATSRGVVTESQNTWTATLAQTQPWSSGAPQSSAPFLGQP